MLDWDSNVVWRFEGDARTREYKLTIELKTDLPADEHEDFHRQLVAQATEWLAGQGLPGGSNIKVEVKRLQIGDCLPIKQQQEAEVQVNTTKERQAQRN